MVDRQKGQTSDGYRGRLHLHMNAFEPGAMTVFDWYFWLLEQTG